MSYLLKKKDKRLMLELFKDGRASNRQIAKAIGMTKETVASRIKQFEEDGVIKGYQFKIDYQALGYKLILVLIKLKNTDKEKINEFKKYLINHKNSQWIAHCFGKFDFKATFILKDINKSNDLVNEITKKYRSLIDYTEMSYVINIGKFSPTYFFEGIFDDQELIRKTVNLNKTKHFNPSSKNTKSENIDKISKDLLYEIGQSPRETKFVDVAQKLNVSADLLKYRYLKMVENGIILGTSVVVHGQKFDKIWGLMLLNVHSEKIAEMKRFLSKKGFLSNYTECLGRYNFHITFFASEIEELYNKFHEIQGEFSEHIYNSEVMLMFDIYKSTQVPKCIKEQD